jgi:hypothetical protein
MIKLNVMKLKDFLDELNALVSDNPKVLEFDVIYSVDDEGNSFHPITYSPTIGIYKNLEFYTTCESKEFNLSTSDQNAICIN